MIYLLSLILTVLLPACAHHRSIHADAGDVQVSREAAAPNCRALGTLEGRAAMASGTQDDALNDLRREAAIKGANFVVVKEYSAYGTAVTGLAYECP